MTAPTRMARIRHLAPVALPLCLLAQSSPPDSAPAAQLDRLAFAAYLYSRLDDLPNTLDYADQVLAIAPDHRGTLLALAALWEARGERDPLAAIADRLLALDPADPEALYFKSAADHLARRHTLARAGLLRNRRLHEDAGRPFPFDSALGSSSALARDWRTATGAYRRILDQQAITDASSGNRPAYDTLLRQHLDRTEVLAALDHASERSSRVSLTVAASTQLAVSTRAEVAAETRHARILDADGWRAETGTRQHACLGLARDFSHAWSGELRFGLTEGSSADFTTALTCRATTAERLTLRADFDAPADDDIPYFLADVRQHRLVLDHEKNWTERTTTHLVVGERSLHAAAAAPEAWGPVASAEIDYRLPIRLPILTPYLQSILIDNPDAPELGRLFASHRADGLPYDTAGSYDLQKTGLRAEFPLRPACRLTTDTFAGTSLNAGGFLYGASAAVRWRPLKNLSLGCGLAWDRAALFAEPPHGIWRAHLDAALHF